MIPEGKCNFYELLSITDDSEEPEPESGSGSGSGIDDSDDDDGSGEFDKIKALKFYFNLFWFLSGFNPYSEPEPPITPPHSPIDTNTRINVHTPVDRNDLDKEDEDRLPVDGDVDVRPPSETNEVETRSSSSTTWKEKRLIISYFLPIVMAWFGGSISSAIVELL